MLFRSAGVVQNLERAKQSRDLTLGNSRPLIFDRNHRAVARAPHDEDRIRLSRPGAAKLARAVRFFETAYRNLMRANEALLAGEPPNHNDGFALALWRDRGYLPDKIRR